MKKIFFAIASLMLLLSACKKDDSNVFDETPDQRLAKTLDALQTQLSGSTTGWVGLLKPTGGGVYSFYFKFNDSNRVVMYSDFDSTTATVAKESSYRLKALQQPSLIFDTYSYIHLLADPDPNVAGGEYGAGYNTDFEFAYDPSTAQADTIKLKGRFKGSTLTLVRASQAVATDINNGGYKSILFDKFRKYLEYFKQITIDGKQYEVNVNFAGRTITFSWLDASGNYQTFTTGYYYSPSEVVLLNPFVIGSTSISTLTDFAWDEAATSLQFSMAGKPVTVVGAIKPLKVDLEAPYRWWKYSADIDDYWFSGQGYHVDGVDDFYGVTRLAGYGGTIFWSNYNLSGTISYDAFAGIINGSLVGSAPFSPAAPPATSATRTTFTDDGRIIFRLIGTFGSATSILNTRVGAQTTIPEGYYLVQTSATSYDMVSAKDARAWISWIF